MIWRLLTTLPLWLVRRASGDKPLVIPAVRSWTEKTGSDFTFDLNGARIIYDEALQDVARLFMYDFGRRSEAVLPTLEAGTETSKAKDFYFRVESDKSELDKFGEEGYKLDISDQIVLTAKTKTGYRRGSMTIIQLAEAGTVPAGIVFDSPQNEKRWLSLDCARHFFAYDYLCDLVKVLAYYKMNGLILHGADAEAFRFEATSHVDLLTRGGYYTKAQIMDLVQLGEDYGVDIIPGFEFPGHSSAFNVAMGTGLPDDCDLSVYPWVTKDWIMDITSERSLHITQEVLTDVLRWFRSPYVHLGADELPDISDSCPEIQAYIDKHKKVGSFADMVSKWVKELADWLEVTHGKKTIIYNGMEKDVVKAGVPKNVIIQFWDQQEDDTYLSDYLENGYKVLNSFPSEDMFYLTPNAYHYIFPDLAKLMLEGLSTALPKGADIEGHVFNIWCDYIYWLEDAYIEKHAALPRAMVASMAWNSDVTQYPTVDDFTNALQAVGPSPAEPPGSPADIDPALVELHHWSFEPTEYEGSIAKSCPDPLCLFIKDNVGSLHGSTYIADPPEYTNNFVRGKYGHGLRWNDAWAKEGVGFGGLDIPPPWTWSAWIRLDERRDVMPLFWSRQGALMLGGPDDAHIGLVTFFDVSSVQNYATHTSFPVDQDFHHLLYTALPGQDSFPGCVEVYLDGVHQGNLTVHFELPMAAIMGYVPLDAESPSQTLLTLDEVRVLSGYAEQEDVDELRSLPPTVAFNNPADSNPAASGPLFESLSALACLLLCVGMQ